MILFCFKAKKLPVLFVSHGAGPCFFMEAPHSPFFSLLDKNSEATKWYKQLATQIKTTNAPPNAKDPNQWQKPKAIIVVSAHWETDDEILVTNQTTHKDLLYDYSGFPDHTYKLKYPAKGNPELAQKIVDLAKNSGIKCGFDSTRNFDHGVFIPLLLMYPAADIPVVEVSINSNFNPKFHIEFGRALQPLREQGVLIIGSGSTTHGSFKSPENFNIFLNSITDTLTNKDPGERLSIFMNWDKSLPHAREAHGREDHLIPLHVVIGAAGGDKGHLLNNFSAKELSLHSFCFT